MYLQIWSRENVGIIGSNKPSPNRSSWERRCLFSRRGRTGYAGWMVCIFIQDKALDERTRTDPQESHKLLTNKSKQNKTKRARIFLLFLPPIYNSENLFLLLSNSICAFHSNSFDSELQGENAVLAKCRLSGLGFSCSSRMRPEYFPCKLDLRRHFVAPSAPIGLTLMTSLKDSGWSLSAPQSKG